MTHIPDEAVQDMPQRIYAKVHGASTDVISGKRGLIGGWNEHRRDGQIEFVRFDIAADHLSAPCAEKLVDVSEVRRQAFEEALQAIKSIPMPMYVETINGHEDAYRAVEALTSAEPVQGDHSGRAALAQGGE